MQQAATPLSLKRRHEDDSGSGIPTEIKAEVDSANKEAADASSGAAPTDGQPPPAKQRKLAAGDTVSTAAGGGAGVGSAAAGQLPAGPDASGSAGQAAGAAAEARLLSDVHPSIIQTRCAAAPVYWPMQCPS